jgi:type IV/VI secretion system ImpK/VasF family protein
MIKYIIGKQPQVAAVEKNNNDKYHIIIEAAGNLPYLITLLRQQNYQVKTSQLYNLILAKIDIFTHALERAEFTEDAIDKAKYLICAAIDEALLCATSGDYKEGLISCFYKEEFGGENFFTILEELCSNIAENIFLIQFGYLLLRLGFEGKYAISADSREKLIILKEKIHAIIARHIEAEKLLNQDALSLQSVNIKLKQKAKLKIIISSTTVIIIVYIILLQILTYKQSAIQKLINLYL